MSEEESSSDLAEHSAEDDEEIFDESKHASLLRSITALDGKTKALSERREVMSMSEHHTPSLKGPVKVHQLVGVLQNKIGNQELKKQINSVKRNVKVLPVPLPKPQQQRIHRNLAYDNVSKELSKWDPVVKKNRLAEQIIYPLEKPDIQIITSPNELVKRIQPKTALETEVAALLGDHELCPEKVLTPAEERAMKAMSIEEARRRRVELQKYRALLSYKEAKARRQNKIKSKKYHRILRKEKLNKEKKLLEKLEKTDPEAFLEKLKEMDANRIQERISLKHRGGSKFARKQMIYNKYSDKSREAVQEMLQKSRELSKKIVTETDSSDADISDDEGIVTKKAEDNSANPWLSSGSKTLKMSKVTTYSKPGPVHNVQNDMSDTEEESNENDKREGEESDKDVMEVNIDSLFDKLEENDIKTVRQMKHSAFVDLNDDDSEESDVEENKSKQEIDEVLIGQTSEKGTISMSMKRKQTLEDFTDMPSDAGSDEEVLDEAQVKEVTQEVKVSYPENKESESKEVLSVDPKKFIKITNESERLMMAEGEEFDEDQTQSLSIAQAFASDDVIEEFTEEKRSIRERDKPKDVNLVLPGWGEWGGEGVTVSKRKRKRFILKAPPAAPRRDRDLENVIISEVKDRTITRHQVSDVPFPFTDPKQFENSIRQPIGKTWNPETAYKKLIEPKKVTFSGKIIPPMDKSQVNKSIKDDHLKQRKKRRK